MNKVASGIIILGLAVSAIIIFSSRSSGGPSAVQLLPNVEVRDGIQYITINAKGGYTPRVSEAQANMPTKLIVRTKGTYDCSLALTIRSIGYQKILPQTGEEIIDLGVPEASTLKGLCSMGMYNFSVNFK